jgi:hypothetical protein
VFGDSPRELPLVVGRFLEADAKRLQGEGDSRAAKRGDRAGSMPPLTKIPTGTSLTGRS